MDDWGPYSKTISGSKKKYVLKREIEKVERKF